MSIPMIREYEGVEYPPVTFNPDDCTLKDQIVDLLESADQAFSEQDMEMHDPTFLLMDAVKILDAAIERLNNEP